ncbi:BlaI/MecI/CopY family transcriptional regulator, partial [Streptomyces sp. SPB074]
MTRYRNYRTLYRAVEVAGGGRAPVLGTIGTRCERVRGGACVSGTERNGGRRRGQGELEARVLAVLHSAPGPVPAGWVREHVGGELAYTTVMTILTRLRSKDAVSRERRGRSFLWSAVADEAGLAALRMRRLLDGEHDRDA